jgi:hypothetical protein
VLSARAAADAGAGGPVLTSAYNLAEPFSPDFLPSLLVRLQTILNVRTTRSWSHIFEYEWCNLSATSHQNATD